MRCAFPACDHDSSQNTSPRVTFHRIPDEESLRAAWMEALGQTDWTPEPGSVVCSEHILVMDLLGTPTEHPLQLCRICFTTDCQMYSMTSFKMLNKAYETVTGILTAEEEHLPRYLCGQCAGRLMNCARFRRKSLRAHSMLLDIVRTHGQITVELIQSELQYHNPFSSDPADNSYEEHFELDIKDLDDVIEQTEARVDESPEDVKFTVDQNHIYGEDGTIHEAIDEFKTENEGFNNIRESYSGDIDGFGNVNKQKDARVYESPEDVKFTVDQNHIYREEGTIHVAIDEFKTESEGLNNIKESHLEDIVCDTIIENSYMNNLNVKIENSEVNDKNSIIENSDIMNQTVKIENSEVIDKESPSDEQTASRHMASTGEDVLDDLTQLEGLGAKTMKKTRRVVNEVETDEQQTPEAGGPSTDDTLRGDICHYQTDSDIQLLEHLKVHAASKKRFHCDMCDYKSHLKNNLIRHLRTHLGNKKYVCNVCKNTFVSKKAVTLHMRIHYKVYSCDVCNKLFSCKGDRNRHLLLHSIEKPYPCDVCNTAFRKKGDLNRHLLIHSNEKPYSCDVCKKLFRRKGSLRIHQLLHSNEKPYPCDVCNTAFTRKGDLNRHLLIHSNENPYPCDVCNTAFRRKGDLNKHLLIHSNEKPYPCDVCNTAFRRKGDLNRHLLIHSNETPYPCDVCNKRFRQKGNLKVHLLIHSNEKPYSCVICKKTLRDKLQLEKHLKLHSDGKLLICDICKIGFADRWTLNTHLKVHSKINRS